MVTRDHIVMKSEYDHQHEANIGTVHLCDFKSATVFRIRAFAEGDRCDKCFKVHFVDGMIIVTATIAVRAASTSKRHGARTQSGRTKERLRRFGFVWLFAMKRSGVADLPLHGGRVPQWLADRMSKLGTAIVESIVLRYGRSELLTRLSDPFWFQALGIGHGNGLAFFRHHHVRHGRAETRTARASDELGIYICGGRGKHSRNTPELSFAQSRTGADSTARRSYERAV